MASTNTNTSINTSVLSTDIYDISNFIEDIRKSNIPDVSDTASMVGIFGYMNEIFSKTLQNTLIAISETSNEAIPTRAKFAKNIMAHALNYGINKIMAEPAQMTLMLCLPISYVKTNFVEYDTVSGKGKFIFDKNVPIYVDKYEYHLDYDVIITELKTPSNEYIYTAMYDLFETNTSVIKQQNPISNITNPYITTLMKRTIDGEEYIAFSARLHQVSTSIDSTTILTNNDIENKTVTFTFEDQLAAFDIDVTENDVTTHLTPVYSGLLDYTIKDGSWCNYQYLDENTIRIIFDRDSYIPGMNAVVNVNIQLTEGANGNFTYNNSFKTSMKSEKYNNYNGMYIIVYPLLDGKSAGGKDKKSINYIKKLIPREASSRGAIINSTDLENFFNSINDDYCKLYFNKKRDNPFERLYYAHMLMRKNANVYPTNTLSLKIEQEKFVGHSGNNNLAIKPGTPFYYYDTGNPATDYATTKCPNIEYIDEETGHNMTLNSKGELVQIFEYICPFLITIDEDLITSYLLTTMMDNKVFKFDSINTKSDLQFIATNMNWNRKFIYEDENGDEQTYDNKYTMDISIAQNTNNINYNLVKYDIDGNGDMIINYDDVRIKVFMVLYSDETDANPYRYIEGKLTEYDPGELIYDFRFTLETSDLMDLNNRIDIKGIYNTKPEQFQKVDTLESSHGYLNNNTYCKIFILADFGIKSGDEKNGYKVFEDKIILYGDDGIGNRTEIETILPTKDDIINKFLRNDISIEKDGSTISVVSIVKSRFKETIGPENCTTEADILSYIRNCSKNSEFIQTLLNDPETIDVIDTYNYEDLSRFTVCNTLTIDGGVDFYYDYSNIMSSVVNVEQVQEIDSSGNLLYKEIVRSDAYGNKYSEFKPIYRLNENGTRVYDYTIQRIPMIKNKFISSELKMEDFIYDLEERRKYINICLQVLEDTFEIDLKFFNTYGPSRRFYYNNPNATTYKAKTVMNTDVIKFNNSSITDNTVVGTIPAGNEVMIRRIDGIYGYIDSPYEGWIPLNNITKVINYIDNVSLTMKFATEIQSSSDKHITTDIISDVKDYIEDINEVNELHIPNIITLITNNYREQIVYFEYLDVNGYGASCQHLYLNENIDNDVCPEFLNIAISDDALEEPQITIATY